MLSPIALQLYTVRNAMSQDAEGVLRRVAGAGEGYTQWLIVELDECATDMLEAVEKSYRYLVEKGLGRGNKG
jgi:hypothetical protein